MKVQMKRKGVRKEKMDKKGEKTGEGGATLFLECPWFYSTKGSGPILPLCFLGQVRATQENP